MTWIILALCAALTEGALVVERKRLVGNATPFQLAFIQGATSALCFGVLLPFVWRSDVDLSLWGLILARSLLDALAMVLMFVALERDEASRVMPITALTPLCIVAVEFVITGHVPTMLGFVGILTIVFGGFLLMYGVKKETGFHITPGMLPMLAVTLLWSAASVIHTVVTHKTGALFYLGTSQVLILVLLVLYGYVRGIGLRQLAASPFRSNMSIGLLATATQSFQMFAQSIAPLASYVLALKRTSLLFGMVGSHYVLKEKIQQRIIPTFLLTLGAVLVLLFG